jgi:hypothetical protein
MSQLKEILLKDDRRTLQELYQIVNERQLLASRIDPIVEAHLDNMRRNFPLEYNKVVNRIIEQKLKSSQQEILDVIYPVMGKMITKYINFQFQQLKENIDNQIRAMFSRKGLIWWIRNRIFGMKDADVFLASIDNAILEEIFVIQRDSGLLLGSAALTPSVNRDVVAGMLTAIKAFVEDAFERENEELETIQYGTYRIIVHNFPSYYFALALSGSVSTTESERFRNQIVEFVTETSDLRTSELDSDSQEKISNQLEDHFILPQRGKSHTLNIKPPNDK